MKEKPFFVKDKEHKIQIKGGYLWKAPERKALGAVMELEESTQKLSIYLLPGDKLQAAQDALFSLVRARSLFYYIAIQIKKRIPSLLLLVPITLTVTFIAFITVWGDMVIKWVFLEENRMTVFGLPMYESAMLYAIMAIFVIYFFPVFLTGEQEGFVQALNERFFTREELRKRYTLLFRFLNRYNYVQTIEIWNADLSSEQYDWVSKSLVPAILDCKIEVILHIRIDERKMVENYFQKRIKKDLIWEECSEELADQVIRQAIPYEYLEPWERNLLAVYTFASTASLSDSWTSLEGVEREGVLNNAVSLHLVKLLIDRFKERLFSEEDLKNLISLDLFAARCLNDYGVLYPALRYTSDVWAIHPSIVALNREEVDEEMKFLTSFLQTEIQELVLMLDDPIAAIKINGVLEKESIYNEQRLAAIRFFVKVIFDSEQYKILKQYWHLIIHNPQENKDMNEDVYRILGVDLLLSLATIFERAAMYRHAQKALDYIERIFPFKGKVGKARIKERQGDFEQSVVEMLQIRSDWKCNKIRLQDTSIVDLNLDISWAIVSGRLEQKRSIGREAIKEAEELLYNKFDAIRNTDQTIRLYNILANYEEWEGRPKGAIENYDKALQIPGVHQSGLSNLLVNKGIALRQIKELKEGVVYGEQGVEIKKAIGDADQLPIAQHNLAQTYIELAFFTPILSDKITNFLKALEHAQDGLNIQAQTGSTKKRGQLLSEKFIAQFELAKRQTIKKVLLEDSWKDVQSWLKIELQAGRGESYDCTVVVKELLACLKEFDTQNIQETINWNIT